MKKKYAKISCAFEQPKNSDGDDIRNQVEVILDDIFIGVHKAEHLENGCFKFTNTINNTPLTGIKIIYLCGDSHVPNHTGKVKEYTDIIFVGFDELKKKLNFQIKL